jgi:uncharacterized small protein (DUF1192 family)
MRWLAGSVTRNLSSARLELATAPRLRRGGYLSAAIALVGLVALSAMLAARFDAGNRMPVPQFHDLEARNVALDAEVARLRTELAMERATRSSLDREVAVLNERIAELRSQVDFFNAQRSRERTNR